MWLRENVPFFFVLLFMMLLAENEKVFYVSEARVGSTGLKCLIVGHIVGKTWAYWNKLSLK